MTSPRAGGNEQTLSFVNEDCWANLDTFTHDLDGNLIEDGDFYYTWDAENRLIGVTPINPGARQRRLEFEYDYMSRRIRKLVFGWNLNTEDWETEPNVDLRFVYDGWNLVQEIDGLVEVESGVTDVAREYTWGLDLSGQSGNPSSAGIHGAGGIGGLLGTRWTSNTTSTSDDKKYIYFYDANGNVGQLIDHSGTTAAKYEYYPFGGLLVATGPAAGANPFRFSTKYRDNETGCYYYGYRYLRTKHGRWLSRDPMDEIADYDLYRFIRNAANNSLDPLGLQQFTPQQAADCRFLLQWVEHAPGFPCMRKLLHHFFKGTGTPSCPQACRDMLKDYAKDLLNAVGYLRGCPSTFTVNFNDKLLQSSSTFSDFNLAFGHVRIDMHANCTTTCCCTTGPVLAPIQKTGVRSTCSFTVRSRDDYDFHYGKVGGILRQVNDCAAIMQIIGAGKPFKVNCATSEMMNVGGCEVG